MAKAGIQINIVGSLNAKALRDAQTELGKLAQAADRSSRTFGDRVRAMGDSMVSAGRRISRVGKDLSTKVTLPLLLVGGAMFGLASDAEESASKVGVVFGDAAGEIKAWADGAAANLGMSSQEALEAAGTFGNLFRAMEIGTPTAADMSQNIVGLASDLASFNNANPTEVLDALRAGLTGEVEPLRRFGVNLNQARIEAEALRLGLAKAPVDLRKVELATNAVDRAQHDLAVAIRKHGENSDEAKAKQDALTRAQMQLEQAMAGGKVELDAAAKAQAAYSLILADTSLAQGDFARTADGAANQQRILTAQAKDLGAELGAQLLPIGVEVLGWLSDLAGKFSDLSPQTQRYILLTGGIAAALGPVLTVIGKVTTGIGHLTRGVTKGAKAAAAIGRGARTAAQGAGRLIAGFRDARVAASQFSGRLGTVGGKLRTMVDGTGRAARKLADLGKAALSAGRKVAAQFARMAAKAAASTVKVVAQLAIQGAKWAWMGVQALAHAAKVAAAWVIAMGPIAIVVAAVVAAVALIVKNWDWVKEKVVAAAKAVWEFIKSAFEKIKTFITETLPKIAKWIIDHHPLVVLFRLAKEKLPGVLTWFGELPGKIVSKIASLGSRLATSVGGAMSTMKTKAVEWGGRILTWYVELPGKIAGKLGSLGGKLAGKAGEAMSAMWGKVSEWGGRIVGWFAGLGDAAKEALGSLGERIVEALKAAWNVLARGWNNLIGGKGFSVPDIPGLPGRGSRVEVPELPVLHTGGVVPGRPGEEVLALLEAGEHVISRRDAQGLRDGGRVVPIDAQRRSEPDRQTSYTFHVYEAQSPAAAADAIAWKLKVSGF